MFSFQYPDPKTNFPYYHCDDPEEFLARADNYNNRRFHRVLTDDDQDSGAHENATTTQIRDLQEDHDGHVHEEEEGGDGSMLYSTIAQDREFLRRNFRQRHYSGRLRPYTTTTTTIVVPTTSTPPPSLSSSSSHTDEEDVGIPSPPRKTAWATPIAPPSDQTTKTVVSLSDIMIEQQQPQPSTVLSSSRRGAEKKDVSSRPPHYHHRSDENRSLSSTESSGHHSLVTPSSEKARLCIFGKKCKNSKAQCTRAHSLEEWAPNVCRFNKRCKNQKCLYFHEGDDKKKYLESIIDSTRSQMAFYSKNKKSYMANYKLGK